MVLVKQLYCDHNATSPLRPAARDAMAAWMGVPANPSSLHLWGARAADALTASREQVAHLIGASGRELVFTSGATEANNIAMSALRQARPEALLICSLAEHPAVLEVINASPRHVLVPIDRQGLIELTALQEILSAHSGAVVSVMAANNETGALSNMPLIAELAHEHGALLHCDATQAVGKIPVDVEEWGVDLLSLSAHKFGGPVGTGALFVSRAARLEPGHLMRGGGQERGWRPGTVNVPGAVGLAAAAMEVHSLMASEQARAQQCRDDFEGVVRAHGPGAVVFNAADAPRLAGVSSVTIPGRPAQALLLAMPNVAASEGSACSSGAPHPSHVLQAMGLSRDDAAATLRFSFGPANVPGDGALAARALLRAIDKVDQALADDSSHDLTEVHA